MKQAAKDKSVLKKSVIFIIIHTYNLHSSLTKQGYNEAFLMELFLTVFTKKIIIDVSKSPKYI